ncbi:MAG: hypothetical protein KUG76_08335 [Gammaproteobacteria bacterium]|nr:hypothetical protein [Gammaproteobacteria bacterium]
MGFKNAKKQVIGCLIDGYILHEERDDIDIKNLLATGEMTVTQVIEILKKVRGNSYSCSPHHWDSTIDVHVVKTKSANQDWYIKWYFIDPNCVFISVHESEV